MSENTIFSILLTASVITMQIGMYVADSPKFVDSTRMKQKFIAWPARHSVRLKCKANGSTPLKFQWLKDGQAKIQRRLQPRIRTDMWYLKLKDLAPLDSGKYTCLVSNAYGSINHTYTLRIVEKHRTKPILKCGYPQNTSVLLGQNASLTCVVVISGTLPDFRWLKWSAVPKMYTGTLNFQNGSYSLVNPTQYETVHVAGKYGVKVNIRNVTSKELGLYTCYVSNHLGYDYRSAFLSTRNKLWRGSLSGKELSLSPQQRLSQSRESSIPLSVFIGVLSIWVVITTLALLWCHFFHKKQRSPELGVEMKM